MKIEVRRGPRIVALLILVSSMIAAATYVNPLPTQSSAGTSSPYHMGTKRAAEQVPKTVPQSPAASTPNSAN